ncbi:MAG: hypothetical protein K2K32_11045 [Muribaculaceae bacterium]|nr:hypothetical protein [Muribaculaceae bacterium]
MKKILLSIGLVGTVLTAMGTPAKIAPGLDSMTDIIYNAEGEKKDVTVTTSGLTLSFSGLQAYQDQQIASHIVYGDNNSVYIYNIFGDVPTETYTKGRIEGDKIVIDLPQAIFYDDSMGDLLEAYYYTLVDIVSGVDDEGYPTTSFVPREKATLTFSIDEFNTMTADELNENLLFGACDSEDGQWIGLGASSISISSFDEQPVEIPSGWKVNENYWTCIGDGYGWQVNFAQMLNEVYFQGLSERLPEACVKGKVGIEDGKVIVSIPQNQYVGDYGRYHIFTKCVQMSTDDKGNIFFDRLMPSDYDFQLIWDENSKTMTAKEKDIVLLFNTSMTDIYMINDLMNMKLIRQESYEGVPEDPYDLGFTDAMDEEGFYLFSFNVPAKSKEGDYLLIDDLSYVIYVDDDVWTFDEKDYFLDEPIEEIPWTFSNAWILKTYESCERRVAFFAQGMETLGVQTVYNHNGVETRSEIVTLNLEEDAVTEIESSKEAKVKYYDLTGHETKNPSDGIYIKRVTYEDGTVATQKQIFK